MLYLPKPSPQDLTHHYDSVKNKIKVALNTALLNKPVIDYIHNEANLKKIITDTPEKLLPHHKVLMEMAMQHCKEAGDSEVKLKEKERVLDEFKKIFNYDRFISGSKSVSYELAKRLNRNTCTYCNRLYANTVVKDKKSGRLNNQGRIIRPQFDHWFNHAAYPILSLSFYNLIPSCGVCNSSIKGDKPFSLDTHVHPYIKEINEEFSFKYCYETIDEPEVKIDVRTGSKMERTLTDLRIEEVYNSHSNLELRDILYLKKKYSTDYLDMLMNLFLKDLGVSKEETYRLVFGIEYLEEVFHKRPFSKFKKDILDELEKIDTIMRFENGGIGTDLKER
jgi:hypothetical protein